MEGARKLRSSMQFMRERKTWLTKLALRAPSCPRFSKTVKRNAPLNSCLCFGSHSLQTGFTWQAQFFCFTNGKKNEPIKTLWKRLLRFVFNHLAEGCKVLALKKKIRDKVMHSDTQNYKFLEANWLDSSMGLKLRCLRCLKILKILFSHGFKTWDHWTIL